VLVVVAVAFFTPAQPEVPVGLAVAVQAVTVPLERQEPPTQVPAAAVQVVP
jgi:hypothetical protein